VAVTPTTLSLAPGETGDYTVTLHNLGTRPDEWAFGSLNWQSDEHAVRSPLAVQTLSLRGPGDVFGSGLSGSLRFPLQFGYTGTYVATAYGLIPPDPAGIAQQLFVANDPNHNYVPDVVTAELPPSVLRRVFTVPAGTVLLRVALYNAETDANADLDLYVYCPSGQCTSTYAIRASTGIQSDETIDIVSPEAGDYTIDVHGYQTEGTGAKFRLFAWALDVNHHGNLQVVGPASATTGDTQNVLLSWENLLPATRYLGAVLHGDGSRSLGLTAISVTTP
jgi:hypothetical protein